MEEQTMAAGPHIWTPDGTLAGQAVVVNQAASKRSVQCHIVIPARLASTRLPRKLLLAETGKPLIQHTYEAALKAKTVAGVCVAADCEEIASVVRGFGGKVMLTSPSCASGTDRIAEVAAQLGEVDLLVNVQGDEPELSGAAIDLVVKLLLRHPTASMATLATPIRSREKLDDPACVKVVMAEAGEKAEGRKQKAEAEKIPHSPFPIPHSPLESLPSAYRALYFSRAAVPHAREWRDELLTAEPPHFYQHLGLYAYRREFVVQFASWPRTPLEELENLEQLRVLEHGHEILVGVIDEPTIGIDTPSDYAAFVHRHRQRIGSQKVAGR
jgi:3-deoxy-manno-octulosonate cytidylyltransferase (CMP-KDO synthetase)